MIREFAESLAGPATPSRNWSRALQRRRRVLVVSSPIGLGHARRDLAIADDVLRALHPDVEIDWLAQHPVTEMLAERGERVHPASRWLANESAHIESESGEHDLHIFQAYRRMDESLVANFHVFHDLVTAEAFDLVVADEGWDVDYFLHGNPELKRSPFSWLTDFVVAARRPFLYFPLSTTSSTVGRAPGLRTRGTRRCPPRCPAARRAALISPGREVAASAVRR